MGDAKEDKARNFSPVESHCNGHGDHSAVEIQRDNGPFLS